MLVRLGMHEVCYQFHVGVNAYIWKLAGLLSSSESGSIQ